MDSFLRNISEKASEYLMPMLAGGDPYKVQQTNMKDVSKFQMISQDGCLSLYKDGQKYICVLYCPQHSSKAFSLFALKDDAEATMKFSAYSHKLAPLYVSSKKLLDEALLNQICKLIRDNPTWTSAHLAAKAELQESFKQNGIVDKLEVPCEATGVVPIHIAVNTGNYEVIQELLLLNVKLSVADRDGENVFHYAAKICDFKVLQMLASRDKSAINQLNMFGESALHTACLHDKPDNVETLLRWGADPCKTLSSRFPIHCAMKASSIGCVETLVKWNRTQLHVQDGKYGGTPLHWTKDREILYRLLDLGCNAEVKNNDGDTALQIMIKRQRLGCVMALLSRSADAASVGSDGNNALHLAIKIDNTELVQTLIVFGCDVNGRNKAGHTPRHIAANSQGTNKDVMVYLLHCVGAERCRKGVTGCREGCGDGYKFNGSPKGVNSPNPENHATHMKLYDTMVTEVAMAAALTRSASASGSSIMDGNSVDSSCAGGDRILSLDGGGIRGLVLIQLLLAIEKAVGQPIRNCFDWIGGTSTGGILALAILHSKTMRYAQGLYFRLKDEVFVGSRPYEAEPLETFMKREFGEHTRMTEVEYPRVLVTGCLFDRKPCELHFFRNYDPPGIDYNEVKQKSNFLVPPPPNDTYVWKAARSSGAAPSFFRSMGKFLDGGLMANNPTLDVLTEIHQHNMNLKALGQGSRVQPMHVVISLGTGRMPVQEVKYADVYRPEGLLDVARVAYGARELVELLIDQATQSEGRPVDRARAWCSMVDVPFFRFSPQLSDNIPLDCKDDSTLINMLWETQCYIHQNWSKFQQIAQLLRP